MKTPGPILTTLIVCVLSLAVAGCGRSDDAPEAETQPAGEAAMNIENREWILTAIGGKAVSAPVDGLPVSLRLDAERKMVSGYGGVNNYSGGYTLDGAALKFGPVVSTRRAGPPEAMATEGALLAAITSTSGARIVDGRLELLASETVLAVFSPAVGK